MRKLIRVSCPPSGLAIYLCPEALECLGGQNHLIRISKIEATPNASAKITIVKDAGGGTARVQEKIRITPQRIALLGATDLIPEFGPIDVKWEPTGNGISFIIPDHEELPEPQPHAHAGGRRVPRGNVRDNTTPHARLGAAIREINLLCASGEVSDVTFSVPSPAERTDFTYSAEDFRITAKRVIEEVLS